MQNAGQNPLAQLRDIHLPDPISWWPPAIGWWLLLFISLAIIAASVYVYRNNRWRREAKTLLLAHSPAKNSEYYYQINRAIKQIAMQRFGPQCAQLSGRAWLEFLDSTLHKPLFMSDIPEFADAPDSPSARPDPIKVQQVALTWLQKHTVRERSGSEVTQ